MTTAGFFAVSALVFFIALGVATTIRDKLAISFAAWVLSSFLFNIFIAGGLKPFLYEVLGQSNLSIAANIEQFIHRNWIIWWGLTQACSVVFGALFLKIPLRGRSAQSRMVQIGFLTSVLLAATSRNFPVFAIKSFTIPYEIVVLFFCVQSFRIGSKGYWSARWLFLGWLIFSVSTILTLSYYFGFLGPSFLTSWGILIAHVAQAVFLGVAIFFEKAELARKSLVLERDASLARLATQVAHDIRSPLAALDVSLNDLGHLLEQDQKVLRHAVARIRDVANDLLGKSSVGTNTSTETSKYSIPALMEMLVNEKRLQFRSRPGIKIDFIIDPLNAVVFSNINSKEFCRTISNLLNNAVEAIEDFGVVTIKVSRRHSDVFIEIGDNGTGIPEHILPTLTEHGVSYGKLGGSGLGLYYARTKIEEWKGNLEIESAIGQGTVVRVRLPEAEAPQYRSENPNREDLTLSPQRLITESPDAILIDDDLLIHLAWKVSAEKADKKILIFQSRVSFIDRQANFDRSTPIYIDYLLGGDSRGDDLAVELYKIGFREIYLTTGYEVSTFSHLEFLSGIRGKEPPW